jgi:hypothetical protein
MQGKIAFVVLVRNNGRKKLSAERRVSNQLKNKPRGRNVKKGENLRLGGDRQDRTGRGKVQSAILTRDHLDRYRHGNPAVAGEGRGKVEEESKFTVKQLRHALPKSKRHLVQQPLVDQLNEILKVPGVAEVYRDNFLGYASILADSRFALRDYANAIKFVSWRLLGDTYEVSFAKAFPERWNRMVQEYGHDTKRISNVVRSYAAGKLVLAIMKQTLIPSWVVNQDLYQKALNVQAELMMTARSEKVRSDAANSLLNQLKMPETAKVELDVKVQEDQSINELREATLALARRQREMIESGAMTAGEVAESKVVRGERL